MAILLFENKQASAEFSEEEQYILDNLYLHMPWEVGKYKELTQENRSNFTHTVGSVDQYSLDFAMKLSAPIVAAGDGIVYTYRETDTDAAAYGNHIKIDHGYFYTLYAHLSDFSEDYNDCDDGCEVASGHVIGYAGSTGYSTGVHLHFGLFHGNAWDDGYAYSVESKIIIGHEGIGPDQVLSSTDFKNGNLYLSENFYGNEGVIICDEDHNCQIDYGNGTGGEFLPGPFPNLHIEELNLHDSAYNKLLDDGTAYLKPGETYEIHVWPESTEEHCLCGTNNEEIEVITDTYVKIGITEDDGSWERIKRSYTHCKYMDEDDSKKEIFFWTVPADASGKLVAFKAKVDATNIIRESNEDDNGCDIEYYPVEGYCPSCPDFVSQNVKLTCGKTELNLGDKFGLETDIFNQGNSDCPIDIHGAYYIKTPNATSWVNIADDTSGASGLSVGETEHEYTTNSPFTANVVGTWQGMFCADYQNQVREQNEDNNCQAFSFKVNPVGPDFIVSSLGFKEGLSFKRKISSHPWVNVRNIGNQTPKSSIRIAYYIDGVFRDDDTIEASELTPGRDQFESVMNNNIRLGDWGNQDSYCSCGY